MISLLSLLGMPLSSITINNYQAYIKDIMQCPTHIKKLEKMGDLNDELCQICGRRATLECKSCKYRQCADCRVCNQRHHMIKIIELNKVKAEYYSNSYACNSCSKSKTVDDDGIWHCNTCNYDLCPDCAD